MPNRLLLPFGNAKASVLTSDSDLVAALQKGNRPVTDFSFRGPVRTASIVSVRIGDLVVVGGHSGPLHAKCDAQPQAAFILPVSGSGRIIQRGTVLDWRAGRAIISNSYHEPVEFSTGTNAIVTLRPATEKLQAEVAKLLGDTASRDGRAADEICARLLQRGPMIDDGRSWSIDYWSALMRIVALIDECNCDEDLLQRIGVEDVVNRLLAQLVLEQDARVDATDPPAHLPRSVKGVELVCEHIRNTIGQPMSISDMEDLTGLTGRSLNYAFRARHGCSPQAWQRNFLLDRARQLLKGDYTGSVKGLSYELGFASPSSFSSYYKQRFGELPSATARWSPRSSPGTPADGQRQSSPFEDD